MYQDDVSFKKEFEQAKTYWQGKFSGEISNINLPYDYERSLAFKREEYKIPFHQELSEKLCSLARNRDVLLYVVLLAALDVLVFKYTNTGDVSIGAPIYIDDGHPDPESRKKLMVFRDNLDNQMTFKELLVLVKQTVIDGYENQYYVVEDILDVLGVDIPDGFSLSRIILLLSAIHKKETVSEIVNSSANDITISIAKNQDTLTLEGLINYNSKLLTGDTASKISGHYLAVLEQVTANINIKLGDIELLSEDEKKQVLVDFNDTGVEYPGDKLIHRLFEEQASRTPGNTALVCMEHGFITYKELNKKANQLSRQLRARGVAAGSIVGLLMQSSLEMAAAILAVLKAGASYLPVDPEFPPERKQYVLKDADARVIMAHRHLLVVPGEPTQNIPVENLIIMDDDNLYTGDTSNLPVSAVPHNLAYVIYTSGTTGKPKGTLVEHRGLVNYSNWRLAVYRYTPEDVTLQLLSYCFDGFASNFYSGLLSGGKLLMLADSKKLDFPYIKKTIKETLVTNMSLVPSIFHMIVENSEKGELQSLRFVVLAGEKSPPGLICECKKKVPGLILFNEYGPTETTVTAAGGWVIDETNTDVIGKPIFNARVYILNPALKPVPLRVPGELYIAGPGLAKGYLNNPELTAEKFNQDLWDYQDCHDVKEKDNEKFLGVQGPFFKKVPGRRRLYKSGDLARWLPDGTVQMLGRIDHQVKVRGFRIEIEEIEKHLRKHPDIKEAVVIPKEDERGNRALYAFVVADIELNVSQLTQHLTKDLPHYMTPSYFIQIDEILLTPNGKVDRKALEAYNTKLGTLGTGTEYIAPGNEMEKTIAEIWMDVLKLNQVGINDLIFELGGNSLNVIQINDKLKRALDMDIPVVIMFEYPTIQSLAAYLDQIQKEHLPGADFSGSMIDRTEVLERGKRDRMKRLHKKRK